jgi:hypothetical protein
MTTPQEQFEDHEEPLLEIQKVRVVFVLADGTERDMTEELPGAIIEPLEGFRDFWESMHKRNGGWWI